MSAPSSRDLKDLDEDTFIAFLHMSGMFRLPFEFWIRPGRSGVSSFVDLIDAARAVYRRSSGCDVRIEFLSETSPVKIRLVPLSPSSEQPE